MKRRDDAKERFCGSRSKLDPISLDLKLIRLPAKFQMKKTHQKKSKERDRIDEKVRSPDTMIPVDLEVEILTRLPGKSLMKFQCVSKVWSSMIRSQKFTDSFFAMHSRWPSRFIIAFTNGVFAKEDANRLFIFSSSYQKEESSSLIANLEMTVPSVNLVCPSRCASVHGFVCCCSRGKFFVCNPNTGKVIILPCTGIGSYTSLGYDPVDNQFKALTPLTPVYQHRDFLVHEVLIRLGGGGGWRRNRVISPPYYPITEGLCINGIVYCGAWTPRQKMNPVIMCFDVRSESLSFIPAPRDVVYYESHSIFIEYNGKLASIVRDPYSITITSFDLWILEDVEKHDWSKQRFEFPFPLMMRITSPGINKAGEIIFAPQFLPIDVQPFYIFYYNLQRRDIRRVRLHGIADTEEFRRRYGLMDCGTVCLAPQHLESIFPF